MLGLKRLRRWLWRGAMVGLLVTNVLTLTSAKFYDFLYSAVSHIPYQNLLVKSKAAKMSALSAQNQRLTQQAKLHKAKLAKAHGLSRKIAKRVARNVAMNVTSVVGESLPYVGIGLIVSVTAADIYDGCQTIKDTNAMLTLFGEAPDSHEQDSVCGMQVPSFSDISHYAEQYSDKARDALDEWFTKEGAPEQRPPLK